ncbi:unnamed protein product [Brassica oleracea]
MVESEEKLWLSFICKQTSTGSLHRPVGLEFLSQSL